jgi:hypothetical protein
MVLQAICDTNLIFWDVVVLAPSGTHDATHLRASSLYRGFMHMEKYYNTLFVTIEGQEVQSYIIVDFAYPPLINIMKVYAQKRLRYETKDVFDKVLQKGQVKIKNAFAYLKKDGKF